MKTPKIFFKKLLLGIVLLVAAALVSLLIKEALDTQDPETALPIIDVRCDGASVPDIYRAAYQWNFFLTTEKRDTQRVAVADMPFVARDAQPGQPINITFSKTPENLRVWRAEGRSGLNFTELSGVQNGSFLTPSSPGVYVYKVYGEWNRGNVLYYFAVEVKS